MEYEPHEGFKKLFPHIGAFVNTPKGPGLLVKVFAIECELEPEIPGEAIRVRPNEVRVNGRQIVSLAEQEAAEIYMEQIAELHTEQRKGKSFVIRDRDPAEVCWHCADTRKCSCIACYQSGVCVACARFQKKIPF